MYHIVKLKDGWEYEANNYIIEGPLLILTPIDGYHDKNLMNIVGKLEDLSSIETYKEEEFG